MEPTEQEQLAFEEAQAAHPAWSHDESMQPSEVLSFMRYYVKLRLKVLLGLHQTTHSLGIKYRWRNWQHQHRNKH